MTIDDELILELIKPNRHGEVGEKALIVKVVGSKKINYRLEEATSQIAIENIETVEDIKFAETHRITPDITVYVPREKREVAIELENDVQWDFGESLRQVKRYKDRFDDVRVIIPEEYKRFAPFYKNEGFRVYLWKAIRKWECLRCETITDKRGPVQPKCKNKTCGNKSRNEFRLIGLKDADIEEYM